MLLCRHGKKDFLDESRDLRREEHSITICACVYSIYSSRSGSATLLLLDGSFTCSVGSYNAYSKVNNVHCNYVN